MKTKIFYIGMLATLFASASASAADTTWATSTYEGNTAGSANWNDSENWTGGIQPRQTESAEIYVTMTNSVGYNVNISENVTLSSLTFASEVPPTEMAKKLSLVLGNSATLTVGDLILNGNVAVSGGTLVADSILSSAQCSGSIWTNIPISNATIKIGTYTSQQNSVFSNIKEGSTIETVNVNGSNLFVNTNSNILFSTLNIKNATINLSTNSSLTVDKFDTTQSNSKIIVNSSTLTITGSSTYSGSIGDVANSTSTVVFANGSDVVFAGSATIQGDIFIRFMREAN